MRRSFDRVNRGDGERGAVLLWTALSLTLLIGVSAFAVDLGWIYLHASRLQAAADAAALAGVTNLPSSPAGALADAADAATANGFPIGSTTTLTDSVVAENEYQVDLVTEVDTFFLKALGFDTFTIAKSATAEYIKPVPIGSPSRCFGEDPTGVYCANDPNFWASISAPYTDKEYGDPFQSLCNRQSSYNSCRSGETNPEADRYGLYNGYYFAIDVPSGATDVKVLLFDAGFYRRSSLSDETGDYRFSSTGVSTTYTMHDVDTTPYDPTDNPAFGCSLSLSPEAASTTFKYKWVEFCNLGANPEPGIYVLHISSGGDVGGFNNYSIAATSSSSVQPSVYGLNDMSIWSNQVNNTTKLYLAEVGEEHAGKTLQLEFFDAGDMSGSSSVAYYTVRKPNGSAAGATVSCTYQVLDWRRTQTSSGSASPCKWQTKRSGTSEGEYNNQWIVAFIEIPTDYTCPVVGGEKDCWWWIDLDMNGTATERTTWTASIIGAPVRLVR